MPREFDGANDEIGFGSDASIDSFTQRSFLAWVRHDAGDGVFITKLGARLTANATPLYVVGAQWSGSFAEWSGPAPSSGNWEAVAFSYDGADIANDPVLYVNGVSQTLTETTAPSGTYTDDAADALIIGETSGGFVDLDGAAAFLVYTDGILTAADVNRHRWWGCAPGGPSTMKVWHPLLNSDLTNKGTAVADGTATGTTVAAMSQPKVERMWGSMMGCGR